MFSGPGEQAAQIFQWGEVLKAMASEGSGLRRLQWVERATPQPSTAQEDWARGAMRDVSSSEWTDYQSLQATIGTAAIHHDVYLGAQVETDTGAQADVLAEAASELAQLCEQLASIGLRPTVLSRRGSRRSCANGPTRLRSSAWRCGVRGRSRFRERGRRPATSAMTRCKPTAMSTGSARSPPGPGSTWAPSGCIRCCSTALPGSVRTVSMHLEAVSTEAGLRRGPRRPDHGWDGPAQARTRRASSPPRRRNAGSTRPVSRERELTRGFRQHRIAGLVMVSSPDDETAGRAWRQAERKAIECHLDLREMHARGHEGWAATVAAVPTPLRQRGCSDAASRTHVGHDPPLGLRLPVPMPGRAALGRVRSSAKRCSARACSATTRSASTTPRRCSLRACWSLGNKGYGKSAFVKAYLHRQSMAGKWMAIFDPKGEYLDLAERDGLSVLALRPGGPSGSIRSRPVRACRRRQRDATTSGVGVSAWWSPWPSRPSVVRSPATSGRW